MNECETVWALLNVSVQSSLVFLRHYKLHLSLTHSLINVGSLLLLPLLVLLLLLFFFVIRIRLFFVCVYAYRLAVLYLWWESVCGTHTLLIYLQLRFSTKTATMEAPMTTITTTTTFLSLYVHCLIVFSFFFTPIFVMLAARLYVFICSLHKNNFLSMIITCIHRGKSGEKSKRLKKKKMCPPPVCPFTVFKRNWREQRSHEDRANEKKKTKQSMKK